MLDFNPFQGTDHHNDWLVYIERSKELTRRKEEEGGVVDMSLRSGVCGHSSRVDFIRRVLEAFAV